MSDRTACTILIPARFFEVHREKIEKALEEAGLVGEGPALVKNQEGYEGCSWYYIMAPDVVGGGIGPNYDGDAQVLFGTADWGNLPDCVALVTADAHYTYPGHTQLWWEGKWFDSGLLGANGDSVPNPVIELGPDGNPIVEQLSRAKEYIRARRAFLDSCRGLNVGENPNINCLEGMRCPRCGSFSPFRIVTLVTSLMYDDGTEETIGSEWDEHSGCECCDCGFEGQVRDFRDPVIEPIRVDYSDGELELFETLRKAEKGILEAHEEERVFPDTVIGAKSKTKYRVSWRVQLDKESP